MTEKKTETTAWTKKMVAANTPPPKEKAESPAGEKPEACSSWESIAKIVQTMMSGKTRQEVRLVSIKCYRKRKGGGVGWIVIGTKGATRMKAFHDGTGATDGLLGLYQRWIEDRLQWTLDSRVGENADGEPTKDWSLPVSGGP